MTFGFPKIKWLHLTGEVNKSVTCSCKIFSGFNTPKIIKKNRLIFDRVIQKIKGGRFGTQGRTSQTSEMLLAQSHS